MFFLVEMFGATKNGKKGLVGQGCQPSHVRSIQASTALNFFQPDIDVATSTPN
jgi:hypothetical protein